MNGIVNATDALGALPIFSGLPAKTLNSILKSTRKLQVGRGEILIRAGDEADSFYVVLSGRFRVSSGGETIAWISAGEPIGELAFFAGGKRTATVTATRDSEVLALGRKAYRDLAAANPAIAEKILATVASRLAAVTAKAPALAPTAGQIIGLVPYAGALPQAFSDQLSQALSETGKLETARWADIPADQRRQPGGIERWIAARARPAQRILLICEDWEAEKAWADAILGNSDTIFAVAGLGDHPDRTPAYPGTSGHWAGSSIDHLVLWRDRNAMPIRNSIAWLEKCAPDLHHHVALDRASDFRRLLRFVQDEAIGLILCGGGAYGTAHLGAYKALLEAGHSFDLIGGTSVGAAMAAALAAEMHPDEVMRRCDEIFVTSRAMNKLTIPVHSVLDHRPFDAQMRKHYGSYRIEDLPINFFAISSSLTRNDAHVHRRGELWHTVRASGSIPAVLPPFITEDGEVLIDGAMIDNVPVTRMRKLKAGPNLVLNFRQQPEWRPSARYDQFPGRLGSMKAAITRGRRSGKSPGIFSILSRAMVLSSRRLLDTIDMGEDVLINLPTLQGMGFLDWTKGRRQFDEAHRIMKEVLEASGDAGQMDVLRQAADRISRL